jgi:plasmid stability protein
MAGLMIRDLPKVLHERLKKRADAHRRSLSKETIIILEEALGDRAGPPLLEKVDELRVRGAQPLTQELLNHAREVGRP